MGNYPYSLRLAKKALLGITIIAVFAYGVFAADFTAELADVSGDVEVTQKSTGKTVKAFKGMKIYPGDTIETMEGASAEILYGDGNVTRMDEDTELDIKELSISSDRSKRSIIKLGVGKIKNSVSKLMHRRSKFEVHTKSAVAGVTGTPPFTVGFVPSDRSGQKGKMEVDLLGKSGQEGSVTVRGTDAAATAVKLTPGTRTVAVTGLNPIKPFKISPTRLNKLQKSMQIITPPEKREEKRQEMEKEIEKVVVESEKKEKAEGEGEGEEETESEGEKEGEGEQEGEQEGEPEPEGEPAPGDEPGPGDEPAPEGEPLPGGETTFGGEPLPGSETTLEGNTFGGIEPSNELDTGAMMDHITRQVSVGEILTPGESETGEETESQLIQGEGSLPGTGEDIVPSTARVRVKVNIINP